jgi:hypothetical protein
MERNKAIRDQRHAFAAISRCSDETGFASLSGKVFRRTVFSFFLPPLFRAVPVEFAGRGALSRARGSHLESEAFQQGDVADEAPDAAPREAETESQDANPAPDAEKDQVGLAEAIEQSMSIAINQANADLAAVIEASKSETPLWLNADGVVPLRLTRRAQSPEVAEALRTAPELEACRAIVEDAGCEIHPSWANGAWILFPLTQEQFEEAGLQLNATHILALNRDESAVREALRAVKNFDKRPKIKVETCGAGLLVEDGNPAEGQPSAGSSHAHAATWLCDNLVEVVERVTFLELRPLQDEEASRWSAPARLDA